VKDPHTVRYKTGGKRDGSAFPQDLASRERVPPGPCVRKPRALPMVRDAAYVHSTWPGITDHTDMVIEMAGAA